MAEKVSRGATAGGIERERLGRRRTGDTGRGAGWGEKMLATITQGLKAAGGRAVGSKRLDRRGCGELLLLLRRQYLIRIQSAVSREMAGDKEDAGYGVVLGLQRDLMRTQQHGRS